MADASQELSLGQFVKQVAALLQEENVELPFKNQRPWHFLFYELAKLPDDSGKPKFLEELVFDWDARYPKCQELSEFLQALHFTGSVSASNPGFESITVDSAVAKRWSQQFDDDDPGLKTFVGTAVELAKKEFAEAAL